MDIQGRVRGKRERKGTKYETERGRKRVTGKDLRKEERREPSQMAQGGRRMAMAMSAESCPVVRVCEYSSHVYANVLDPTIPSFVYASCPTLAPSGRTP